MDKYITRLAIALLLIFYLASCDSSVASNASEEHRQYFGQLLPGSTPKVFAPGIVSTEDRDQSGFFSPDMREFYFTRKDLSSGEWSLISFKFENDGWHQWLSTPRIGRPTISPDGKILHLGKYFMERTDDGWSDVKKLGEMFDREDWGIMRLSASLNGTYVFEDYKNNDVIRISTVEDGLRRAREMLGREINTGRYNAHPFIASDGSYLIWDGERDGGFGNIDLWISFRQKDGLWGNAINMGPRINTGAREAGGYVTPDGKYFFFNRSIDADDADIFWVDAQIIEDLKSTH